MRAICFTPDKYAILPPQPPDGVGANAPFPIDQATISNQ